jgi:phosphate transport system protein
MSLHFRRDLEHLKREILAMGALVETATNRAVAALEDRRVKLAAEVEAGDGEVDSQEIRVESLCTRILALHQPVASDLRFVVACLKVNNDLERIGDLAVNIAERASVLGALPALAMPREFREITGASRGMLHDALDALVNADAELAERVIGRDDEVDALNRRIFSLLEERMQSDPSQIARALHVLSCSRHLERIADMATNISEEVVYFVRGKVVRHGHGHRV